MAAGGKVERTPGDDLRLELRCRNNVLYRAIFDVYGSVAEFCRVHAVDCSAVGALLNLKVGPFKRPAREWRKLARQLAVATGISPEELFPADLYSGLIPSKAVAEVSSQRFVTLQAARHLTLPASQEDGIAAQEVGAAVEALIQTLRPREQTVIRMRFGLNEDTRTVTEVAKGLGVSRVRVGQIEAEALRKLRQCLGRPRFMARLMKSRAGNQVIAL